jgi:sterol desaturase/sphingolipid hydroxylase (fatty acid hydroxylase superfamily)
MSLATLSFFGIAFSALIIIVLERSYPYNPGQKFLRDGLLTDLVWYTLLQSYVLAFVIGFLIRLLNSSFDLTALRVLSNWPLGFQLLFCLVVHDLYIYCFHRLQHHSSLLWRIHEAHHSVRDVDWLAGSRSHALEILINQTVEFLPMAALGAHADLALLKGMVDAVWGMYIHANLNVHSGWLQYVMNGRNAQVASRH